METENGFRGEYGFLSNFAPFDKPFLYDGIRYPTNEHFYQAMKFKDRELRFSVSQHPSKGLKKFISTKSELIRDDWEEIKVDVMRHGLNYKFSANNPQLRKKLADTDKTDLVEYNWWNDKFWGVSLTANKGRNTLGKLLMEIRGKINEE